MKNVLLYTNTEGLKLDLTNIGKAKKQLSAIYDFLKKKGIDPDELNLISATKKIFVIPVEAFKGIETAKIKKIIDSFGETAITDGWEVKVNQKVEAYKNELISLCPAFDQPEYLKYFSFENGVAVKEEFEKQFFIDKNSVILSDSNQLNFYIKHQKAAELLNELMNHPDNEFEALGKLFYFNPQSKEFEMNLLQYYDVRIEQEAAKKKIEGEEYTKICKQRYEDNCRKHIDREKGDLESSFQAI